MKYCECENSYIKNGICSTCGLPFDFTPTDDELDLKEHIKSILHIDEEEFIKTPAKELYKRMMKKSNQIKSN
jgi:hypothetical protein